MLRIKWGELFPSKLSIFIFIAYMSLFVNQGVLVTASQSADSKYSYNTTAVVFFTEVAKLVTSILLYCRDNTFLSLLTVLRDHRRLLLLYFVPSLLYCLYNNLAFTNLATFDPTTYYLLLQFRVVITALLFQVIFRKKLTGRQWASLVMLTLGCMLKGQGSSSAAEGSARALLTAGAGLVLLQAFCSSLAGVYNEYLLKSQGAAVDIYAQNVFMYADSIACNLAVLIGSGQVGTLAPESLHSLLNTYVILIIINGAAIGVVTSFFLKTMNSILKTFASALELAFTAVVCYLIFGIAIDVYTASAIAVVSFSVIVYSQNPVDNTVKQPQPQPDSLHLLEEGASE